MRKIYMVVRHFGGLDQLVRLNEDAFLTREAAEDHIKQRGNKELPDTGGLMMYAIQPLELYKDHKEWIENVAFKAKTILDKKE